MITDLRSAVEWLSTLRCAWTLDTLAELGLAKRDRAQFYATLLVRQGVLVQQKDGQYHAGPKAAEWRNRRSDAHTGGNATSYRKQREIREQLRAKEFQALRSGKAIDVPQATDDAERVAERERRRIASSRNALTCHGEPTEDTDGQGEPMPDNSLLTLPQAADRLAISVRTLRRMLARQELHAVRLSRQSIRVAENEITTLIARRTAGAVKG